jgi:hypothetical protein
MKKIIKKRKHLDYYKRCMLTGYLEGVHPQLPFGGLCRAAASQVIDSKIFRELIVPSYKEREKLSKEGKSSSYWASGHVSARPCEFTPLRQTIVLLMAAIKGEL